MLGISLLALIQFKESVVISTAVLSVFYSFHYLAYGYVFNNLYDQEEDHSLKKNPFKKMSSAKAKIITLILLSSFLLNSVFLDVFYEALFICFLNALYSIKPFRLKHFMLFSLIANGLFFSFVFYASAKIINKDLNYDSLMTTLYVFCLFIPIQFIHCLEHSEEEGIHIAQKDYFLLLSLYLSLTLFSYYSNQFFYITLFYSSMSFFLSMLSKSASKLRSKIKGLSFVMGIGLCLQLYFS
jgi:hypothetical protein